MPSRLSVFAIVLFWLGTTAFVVRRDVWPRLFSSGPPPVSVDVGDEASQLLPTAWTIYRGTDRVGRLETRTTYVDADNTYQFTHEYVGLQLDVSGVRLVVPKLKIITHVAPDGSLRAQSLAGRCEAVHRGLSLLSADLRVNGRVVGGEFVGTCDFASPLFNIKRDLVPVPVPNGHALSPLQVVNRINGIRPRREWVVHEVNPLADAVAVLFKEKLGETGLSLPEKKRDPLIARVSSTTQDMTWKDEAVPCWVIEYRDAEVKARTWVRASDGKVLKQEAFEKGEQLTVLRDE